MSAAEETIRPKEISKTKYRADFRSCGEFLSSVKFGIVLLCILVVLSMVGMLVIQQNVQGFDSHYAGMTPAEKTVYAALGIFDIYHSWYYNFLLLVLSLNIVLASIDRFPSAWKFISKPKLDASRKWLLGQKQNAVIENYNDNRQNKPPKKVFDAFKKNGFSARITEKKGKLYVFGESGKLNRLGAYIVHVFLLTLFLGHFVALQTGFDADVRLTPDSNPRNRKQRSHRKLPIRFNLSSSIWTNRNALTCSLPFTITCNEIEQKLIDPNGSIEINNTLDWRTQIKIDDPEYGETVADVSLNRPFEYRGYRFFQASAITIGSASEMTLERHSANGGAQPMTVNMKRNGTAESARRNEDQIQSIFSGFRNAGRRTCDKIGRI